MLREFVIKTAYSTYKGIGTSFIYSAELPLFHANPGQLRLLFETFSLDIWFILHLSSLNRVEALAIVDSSKLISKLRNARKQPCLYIKALREESLALRVWNPREDAILGYLVVRDVKRGTWTALLHGSGRNVLQRRLHLLLIGERAKKWLVRPSRMGTLRYQVMDQRQRPFPISSILIPAQPSVLKISISAIATLKISKT